MSAKKKALDLLSRREHTRRELTTKLAMKGFDKSIIDEVIQDLIDNNYQSDVRFAMLFAEQKMEKGYGPIKILAHLYGRGIDSSLAQVAIESVDVDWEDRAKAIILRKYNLNSSRRLSVAILRKCQRFLYSRGFTHEQIRKALK